MAGPQAPIRRAYRLPRRPQPRLLRPGLARPDCNLCEPDLTGDGLANTLDVLEFLNLFAAANPSADWNLDGAVNTLDVLAYLNAWAAGCP